METNWIALAFENIELIILFVLTIGFSFLFSWKEPGPTKSAPILLAVVGFVIAGICTLAIRGIAYVISSANPNTLLELLVIVVFALTGVAAAYIGRSINNQ